MSFVEVAKALGVELDQTQMSLSEQLGQMYHSITDVSEVINLLSVARQEDKVDDAFYVLKKAHDECLLLEKDTPGYFDRKKNILRQHCHDAIASWG